VLSLPTCVHISANTHISKHTHTHTHTHTHAYTHTNIYQYMQSTIHSLVLRKHSYMGHIIVCRSHGGVPGGQYLWLQHSLLVFLITTLLARHGDGGCSRNTVVAYTATLSMLAEREKNKKKGWGREGKGDKSVCV